jgi:hypothetical protein
MPQIILFVVFLVYKSNGNQKLGQKRKLKALKENVLFFLVNDWFVVGEELRF